MIEDGRVVDSMRVIVGKADKQTPLMASMIHYATFNPYWNVPDDLVRERIAPNVMALGTKYLRERGYEVLLNWSNTSPVLSPEFINWRAVAAGLLETWIADPQVRQLLLANLEDPDPLVRSAATSSSASSTPCSRWRA